MHLPYVLNSTLQCLSYVIFCPIIIVLGLIVACALSQAGKLFGQTTQLYTISPISCGGYLSNGMVGGNTPHFLFYHSYLYLSTSGTSSSVAHKFIDMPLSSISFCMCLNCPSASVAHTLNPQLW